MYTYKVGITAQEHDKFVKNHPQANLLQSSSWARIKDNWENERIGFYKEDKLLAVASILIKSLPFGFTMLYIPRGPVMDYLDKDLLAYVLQTLKDFGRRKRAFYIKFDPLIVLRSNFIGQEVRETQSSLQVIENLQKEGVIWTGLTTEGIVNIQPRFQANIYGEFFGDQYLSKSTRQAIRTAQNKGVTVRCGGLSLLDDFSNLMKKTEKRKGLHLRDRTYYRKLLEIYSGHSYITLSTLDILSRIEVLTSQLERLHKVAATFSDAIKPSKVEQTYQEMIRIEEEIAFLKTKTAQGLETVPLSATLVVEFGKTSEIIYAGMDEEFRRYQPAILTWYHTAVHAFERGMTWQNMGGVENCLSGGLYSFKSKFHPVIEELIGEFNLPISSLYRLTDKVYRLLKKTRGKH